MAGYSLQVFKVHDLGPFRSSIYKAIFSLVFFMNPYTMVNNATTLNFVPGSIIFTYILLKLFDIGENAKKVKLNDVAKLGIALGIATGLDARYFVFGLPILLVLLLMYRLFERNTVASLKSLMFSLFVASPFFIYIYYTNIYNLGLGSLSFPAIRETTYAQIRGWSTNANLFFIFHGLGQWWPGMELASPSILFSKLYEIFGDPPALVLTKDPLSLLFLSALSVWLALAFLSVLVKSARKFSVPLAAAELLIIAIASGGYFPVKAFTMYVEVYPAKIPLIGGILSDAFALPYYILYIIGPSFLILLISITLLGILRKLDAKIAKTVLIVIVVLMSFASWQFFNGSYYPGSNTASPIGKLTNGNYQPVIPPKYFINAYENLSTYHPLSITIPMMWNYYNWTNSFIGSISNPTFQPPPNFVFGFNPAVFPNFTYIRVYATEYGASYMVVDKSSLLPYVSLALNSYKEANFSIMYNSKGPTIFYNNRTYMIYYSKYAIYSNKTLPDFLLACLMEGANDSPIIISPVAGPAVLKLNVNSTTSANTITIYTPHSTKLLNVGGQSFYWFNGTSYIVPVSYGVKNYIYAIEYSQKNNGQPSFFNIKVEKYESYRPLELNLSGYYSAIIVSPIPLSELAAKPFYNVSYNMYSVTFSTSIPPNSYVTFVPFTFASAQGAKVLGTNYLDMLVLYMKSPKQSIFMPDALEIFYANLMLVIFIWALTVMYLLPQKTIKMLQRVLVHLWFRLRSLKT
ncbi:MAG: hypothetical protein JRN26_08405 [Nitrososphaerota archaeon]|nr:hypothetical protein [Nitrososphaerota archaeon]